MHREAGGVEKPRPSAALSSHIVFGETAKKTEKLPVSFCLDLPQGPPTPQKERQGQLQGTD